MRRAGWSLLILLAALPGLADAGPICPPESLRDPLPGVEKVTLFQTSVSTARFPGQWQEGVYGPEQLSYRLYQDGSGSVVSDPKMRGWHVDFTCDLEGKSCTYDNQSFAPEAAMEAAKAIGDCLIAVPPKPKPRPSDMAQVVIASLGLPSMIGKGGRPDPAPKWANSGIHDGEKPIVVPPSKPTADKPKGKETAKGKATAKGDGAEAEKGRAKDKGDEVKAKTGKTSPNASAAPSTPAETSPPSSPAGEVTSDRRPDPTAPSPSSTSVSCWAEHLTNEPAAMRLQRLLLLAGYDPGPIDGQLGQRTRSALLVALGPDAEPTATEINARRLTDLLCGRAPDLTTAPTVKPSPATALSGTVGCR